MIVAYRVTEESKKSIKKYDWINSNFELGEIGDKSNKEIIRLLENTHYGGIRNTLDQINTYGKVSGDIGENILRCNDILNFPRYLAELNLFAHIFDRVGDAVTPLKPEPGKRNPDYTVDLDIELLIELFTPMDYYGYQALHRFLHRVTKYLNSPFGYFMEVKIETNNPVFALNIPEFKEVKKWCDGFGQELIVWLKSAENGFSFTTDFLVDSIKIHTILKQKLDDADVREVLILERGRSTDSIQYFRMKSPEDFADSQWGKKIKGKMELQQAGDASDYRVRIFIINLSSADTTDLSFLMDPKYHVRCKNNIKYISSKISSNPPYDIVIFSELGFDCGFSAPIILSEHSESAITKILNGAGLSEPIKPIKMASEEECAAFWESIFGDEA